MRVCAHLLRPIPEHRDSLEYLRPSICHGHMIGGMAQYGYLGCGVPHKVITRREPPNCESQNFDGRAHLAGRLAIHEVARVLQVSCSLIVVATSKIQILPPIHFRLAAIVIRADSLVHEHICPMSAFFGVSCSAYPVARARLKILLEWR